MSPYEVYFHSSGGVESKWSPKDVGLNRANAIPGYISLGVAGDVFHPRVEATAKRIRDAAERRGVPVANVIYNPFDRTEIERKIGEGYKLFSVFLDVQLFRQSLERLYDEVRAAL